MTVLHNQIIKAVVLPAGVVIRILWRINSSTCTRLKMCVFKGILKFVDEGTAQA
jgi:hypothetical protein